MVSLQFGAKAPCSIYIQLHALKTAEKKQTWRQDGGTISVGRLSKSEPKRQAEMLQHMTQHELFSHQSSSRYRANIGLLQNGTSLPSTTFSWQSMQIQILTPLQQRAVLALRGHLLTCLAATACGQLRYLRVC